MDAQLSEHDVNAAQHGHLAQSTVAEHRLHDGPRCQHNNRADGPRGPQPVAVLRAVTSRQLLFAAPAGAPEAGDNPEPVGSAAAREDDRDG
jgi:hypothetical protein